MARILLDTSAIFALINPEDDHHPKAIVIHESLVRRRISLVLPNFILAESHTIINRRLGYQSARAFLNAAIQDYEIERVTIEDEWAAHALLQETTRTRNLSYFDAVAICLAERLDIEEIFTFDNHFKLMGFKLSIPAA